MSEQEQVAVEVVVTGRVQGVFYRDSLRTEAERAGVHGWVRNEDDGSVRALLEGTRTAVDDVVAWCRSGPPRADVNGVRTSPGEATGSEEFRVV